MGIPPPIEVANLGMADTLILMVLALVVFGPRRLPQIGRQIGKLMYEFRKASNDFKYQMEEEMRNAEEADRRKREEAERQRTPELPAPGEAEANSQTPEAGAADVGLDATGSELPGGPLESPSATESTDPYGAAYETNYDAKYSYDATDSGGANPAEREPEETVPRIQPPATGAPVAAKRPTRRAGKAATADLPVQAAGTETERDSSADATAAPTAAAPAVQEPTVNGTAAVKKRAAKKRTAATEPTANHG